MCPPPLAPDAAAITIHNISTHARKRIFDHRRSNKQSDTMNAGLTNASHPAPTRWHRRDSRRNSPGPSPTGQTCSRRVDWLGMPRRSGSCPGWCPYRSQPDGMWVEIIPIAKEALLRVFIRHTYTSYVKSARHYKTWDTMSRLCPTQHRSPSSIKSAS